MQQLTKSDLNFVLTRTPRDIRNMLKTHERELFLAGGFIRATIAGEKVSDIDLFGRNATDCSNWANKLALERKGRLHKTDNAITILAPPRVPVQFITRWLFEGAGSLVSSFDYTICQAAIWAEKIVMPAGDDGKEEAIYKFHSLISDTFYSDLAARRLVYTYPKRVEEVGGSLLRALKFVKKGYNIQAPSIAGVVARAVSAVEWGKVGTEKDAAMIITGLLRQVDPLLVIDGTDFIDEHEIIQE